MSGKIDKDKLYSLIDKLSDEYAETDNDKYNVGYLSGISHCMEKIHEVLIEKEKTVIEHD